MKIYVELLFLIIIPMLIFIGWYWGNAWSRKRILKKYTPEDNISKKPGSVGWLRKKDIHNGKKSKGGDFKELGREEPIVGIPTEDSIGPEQLEGRELLPTTNVNDDGKTSNSDRKNGSSIRKLLGRRSRK